MFSEKVKKKPQKSKPHPVSLCDFHYCEVVGRGSMKPCIARRLAGIFSVARLARKEKSVPLSPLKGTRTAGYGVVGWCSTVAF